MKTTLPPTTDHRPVIGERMAVHLRSLRKVHGKGAGAVTALQDVDHGFPAGTFTAVMGPSGSGKSTLMHCAAGLERPTAGSVELGGRDLGTLSDRQLTLLRRDHVGFVFQDFHLVPALNVTANVELPCAWPAVGPMRSGWATCWRAWVCTSAAVTVPLSSRAVSSSASPLPVR